MALPLHAGARTGRGGRPDRRPAAATPLPADGTSVGELEVRGPWITARYVGDDAPEEEKFRDGWLRTGDVGTLSPDGFITLTDRAKDVIKSGGEWISSVELENALMAHPAVLEACVVGVPDERWGERPLATVVVREGASATAEELRDFLAATVARWQLPERWAFIDAVPKTSVGKFDKKVVRSRYAEGGLGPGADSAVTISAQRRLMGRDALLTSLPRGGPGVRTAPGPPVHAGRPAPSLLRNLFASVLIVGEIRCRQRPLSRRW